LGDSNPSSTPESTGGTRGAGEGTLAGGAMLLRESVIALDPGSVLAGRYQIRRVVGKGATGVVLEADDRVSRSLVALKVFKPEIATDDRWQEIVGSELRHARRLSHPNVCRVFDAGEADGYRFLSMEYAPGGSLRQRLKDVAAATDGGANPRPMEERVADGRAVVDGLAAIHGAGIIHRDVKPDNVLRMDDGRLVVTDFGLAVAPGQTTFMSGYSGAVGTPSYMAPEVALGGDATMASDVFAVGVILHEIFFGRRPEWHTTKRGRFVKPPAVRKGARIEKSIARLCLECLEPLAPRRPQTAGEVKKKFERAVLGRYGSFKGAMKAGKWGIVTGVILAVAAAAGTLVLTRPGNQSTKGHLTGKAANWSRDARLVARNSGRVRCVYSSKDPAKVRVIWGQPWQGATIDVRNGRVSSWSLAPDLLSSQDCPRWTANGDSVLYTVDKERPQVMLSRRPDGSDATSLVSGYVPQWLRVGQEIVFAIDRRRAAVTDLAGNTTILSEAARPEESLFSIDVNEAGNLIGVLYRDFRNNSSAVVIYEHPSGKVLRRIEIPLPSWMLSLGAGTDTAELVVDEGGQHTLVKLTDRALLTRTGSVDNGLLVDVHRVPEGRLLSVLRRSSSLVEGGQDSAEQVIAHAREFGRISLAADGNALVDRQTSDGRWLIARYDPKSRRLVDLTSGPMDRDPLSIPGGSRFAYVVANDSPRIRVCDQRSPDRCETLTGDGAAARLAGVSPSGESLAYFSRAGVHIRMRLLKLTDGSWDDLGPIAANCRVRWTEEGKLWFADRRGPQASWIEVDVRARRPTGQRQAATKVDGDGCPAIEQGQRAGSLRSVARQEAELWFVPAQGS
jgi:serine/threonine protein kinase